MLPVELHDLGQTRFEAQIVERSHVHRVELRRPARPAEHVNATDRAEVVAGLASAEPVRAEVILPAEETKARGFDCVVQRSLLAADRAIALHNLLDRTV